MTTEQELDIFEQTALDMYEDQPIRFNQELKVCESIRRYEKEQPYTRLNIIKTGFTPLLKIVNAEAMKRIAELKAKEPEKEEKKKPERKFTNSIHVDRSGAVVLPMERIKKELMQLRGIKA